MRKAKLIKPEAAEGGNHYSSKKEYEINTNQDRSGGEGKSLFSRRIKKEITSKSVQKPLEV